MRCLTRHQLTIPTIVLVGENNSKLTLRLLRMGVVECLSEPLYTSRLAMLADVLTVRARCVDPVNAPGGVPKAVDLPSGLEHYVIVSPAMRQLMDRIRLAAPLDSTILMTGETGTGKTCLARMIHLLSPRNDRPFLVINCSALSANLIESEMFGHARGAFTGADENRIGKLEASCDGTLFLDDIDTLPLDLQAKLLRAVEERLFEPVGSNKILPLQARLIAAANRSLEDEVAAGRFRADLYFRLNVLDMHVPPLRERRVAIPHLIESMLTEFTAKLYRNVEGFSAAAWEALTAYDWPGNMRELRNVVERAVALSTAPVVELSDLPDVVRSALHHRQRAEPQVTNGNRLAETRHLAESRELTEVLQRHNNNRSHAAADLGISRVTLYKKLRKHGMM
jgi:DNA-binding NtrC family response regulator